ncbi:MAG TPA: ROK family protein [Bryobacteraceae bacterium]|nr:ROK family protein [Bryobacteraceae bacterium]
MSVLGVDIGGTKIAAGTVNDGACVVHGVTVPTRAAEGYDVSIGQVYKAIGECLPAGVRAIGICAPGPLNPKTGVILNPPNLPGWRNVPLANLVGERFGLLCRVENDANAAGLAEARFGAARGFDSVLYVTLSTGIGAGIILDGKVYHGKNGAAAEGGHVTIDWRSGTICNCGTPGCIEALASGSAIAKRGRTPEQIADGVARGDGESLRILDEIASMLGAWMGSMISLLDPDIIVVGGGVSRIGEPLFSRLRRIAPSRTINQFAAGTPIMPAELAENVGIIGAASVVL